MLCGRQSFAARVPGSCLGGLVELGRREMEADAYVLGFVLFCFLFFGYK